MLRCYGICRLRKWTSFGRRTCPYYPASSDEQRRKREGGIPSWWDVQQRTIPFFAVQALRGLRKSELLQRAHPHTHSPDRLGLFWMQVKFSKPVATAPKSVEFWMCDLESMMRQVSYFWCCEEIKYLAILALPIFALTWIHDFHWQSLLDFTIQVLICCFDTIFLLLFAITVSRYRSIDRWIDG